ncbi:MAG TPA: VOC family protein [Vicinamibacterales bacterium]|nr:VOC family protein [Vicinamibacterales bacterium]
MIAGIAASLLHVDMVVQDLERSIALYTQAFGFEVVEDCVVETDAASFLSGGATRKMRLVFLSLNRRSTMVELIQLLDEHGNSLPASTAGRFDWNLTFLVNNLEHVKSALGTSGLRQVSEEFLASLPKLGTSRVLFCRDSEGCLIEFVAPA